MVRWRFILFLAMLLLPAISKSELDEDSNQDAVEEDEDDSKDEDGDEDESPEKDTGVSRRTPLHQMTSVTITRTTPKKRPLECYVCAYKNDLPVRSCLEPSKNMVATKTCYNADDKCFTSVISKDNSIEAVERGCRSSCIGSTGTTCCEQNRCNNEPFSVPVAAPQALAETGKSSKTIPSSVLFFVTILLVVQTVLKVVIT